MAIHDIVSLKKIPMLRFELEQILADQEQYFTTRGKIIPRLLENQVVVDVPMAVIVCGIRRSGKSTLLKHLLQDRRESVGYIHFDDPRLNGFTVADFYTLEDIWKEKTHFQFDEIQKVERWEEYIRHGVERMKRYAITGSNAGLLSKELGTLLTGRHITYELFPFSYREFLTFHAEEASFATFEAYLKSGGFPETLIYDMPGYHAELFRDIIQRDIAVRYGIRNSYDLNNVALHLLNNPGKPFSFAAIARHYGIPSVHSVADYVRMFEDAYLISLVPRFDYSFRKQQNNPKKSYVVDHAFARANSTQLHEDLGRMLENMVYMELRRQSKSIWYFKEKNECDFVFQYGKHTKVFQSCWELTAGNKDREINGLLEAMQFFKLEAGTIVTANQRDSVKMEGMEIRVVPFYEWALDTMP